MSKMTAIEIKDFMSIGYARLTFDESGILCLCGYNDSGKSAITRLLEIMLYNSYSTEQVRYIRDDCPYWGCSLEFDDGVEINRYKYQDGKSVWEMKKDGDMVYTNTLGTAIASIGDIPDVIVQYLSVIQDEITQEKLNVRRNTDKLFLVETTGGDNYKILSSVLQSDLLAAASMKLTEDRNRAQQDSVRLSAMRDGVQGQLNELAPVSEEALGKLEESLSNLTAMQSRVELIQSITTQSEEIRDFRVYDEIEPVDMSRFTAISGICEAKKEADIPVFDTISLVDTSRLELLSTIMEARSGMVGVETPEVVSVNTERLADVMNICKVYNELYSASQQLNSTTQQLEDVNKELLRLSKEHGFKVCGNCGAIVV